MATLILSTAGTLIGGPIGGAIGAIIGQQIDQRVFAPKGRNGPRLNELAVQSSAYGSSIPKLFGSNRVAGTVIWATDLKETKRKVSNGKGRPKSTVYSYSASFAVALSARRIVRVGRIWADGSLLRGGGGDFKSETGFRLHAGNEAQPVDPLIASAEGVGMTPAYRGLAYAVFEDFQLGDFGNRIPALSFEVVADDGDVSVGQMLSELAGAGVIADDPALLQGFAATGDAVRGVAETLASLFPYHARDDGAVLRLESAPNSYGDVTATDQGASPTDKTEPRLARERRSEATLPATLSVAHYEPARDYQQGLQRVSDGGGGRRDLRIDMPVTLDAGWVKRHAVAALQRMRAERVTAKIRLPWRYLDLEPGQRLAVPGDATDWRVSGVMLDRMVVEVDLTQRAAVSGLAPASDPGRNLSQPDLVHGPTLYHLLDLPQLDDTAATAPRIAIAAAGLLPGWRRASLLLSLDDGASWQEAGATAAPAVIGVAKTALQDGSALLFDEAGSVEVALLHGGMTLQECDRAALLAGANAAMLGDELIQFRTALPLGENRYRLSGLLRGRRGTEWAISSHAAGERFILIEADALAFIDIPPGAGRVRTIAVGIQDAVPPEQGLVAPGQALFPLPPSHLAAILLANGDTEIRWMRRSRNGWRWLDGVDAPLVEEVERYAVTFTPDTGSARVSEQSGPGLIYDVAARAADLANGATRLIFSVRQIGSSGQSRPTAITIPLT
jgi:hypothetical protein